MRLSRALLRARPHAVQIIDATWSGARQLSADASRRPDDRQPACRQASGSTWSGFAGLRRRCCSATDLTLPSRRAPWRWLAPTVLLLPVRQRRHPTGHRHGPAAGARVRERVRDRIRQPGLPRPAQPDHRARWRAACRGRRRARHRGRATGAANRGSKSSWRRAGHCSISDFRRPDAQGSGLRRGRTPLRRGSMRRCLDAMEVCMRTVLVNLEVSPVLDSALQCALLLVAQRFGSYIEGLHMRPGQPDIIAAGADGFVAAAPDLVASFEREAQASGPSGRGPRFEAFMASNAPAARHRPAPGRRRVRRLAHRGHQRAWRDRQPRPGVRPDRDGPAAAGRRSRRAWPRSRPRCSRAGGRC